VAEVLSFRTAVQAAPPDAAARAQALEIRESFIVEAPAGSGKTGLLIQRFLKLLADDSVTAPEQVLAITFTKKATAELRERVLHHLEQASLKPAPETHNDFDRETLLLAQAVLVRDRQLGWSLLEHPHRLHLRTIDSVSAEIARTLPILSGSGGRLTPTEDAVPLHREATRRTVLLLGSGDAAFDAALRTLLLHRDGNLAEIELLLAEMLKLRDQWGNLIPLTHPELDDTWLDANVLPRLEQALDQAICTALTHLTRTLPPHVLDELTALAADFGHHAPYDGSPSPVALCAGLRTAPEAVSAHLERWRAMIHLLLTADNELRKERGITGKNLKFDYNRKHHYHPRLVSIIDQISGDEDLLAALCDVRNLPPAQYPADQWIVAKALFRILSRGLVELQLVFRAHNQCDFTELSLLARHALEQDSGADDLASALGARLQHLLVDEMQDTSTPQYELIQGLTASWDGHSQTVFLVGDPRQSIYLFRQARVERFLQAMHTKTLGELPLTRLRLTANFRSQATLVKDFNHNFNLIFPPSINPQALPYTLAAPTLPESAIALSTVWHTQALPAPAPGEPHTPAQIRQLQSRREAVEILKIARNWIARPLPPGRKSIRDEAGREFSEPWRIAVLVRSRNHLAEIVAALRRESPTIPFRAVEIESLHERQEILDLTGLTRALLHPADRVAALAILRAPWCGLSLADLYTLTGADDPALRHQSIARLMAGRGHLLSPDGCDRLTRIWTVLQAAAAQRASLTSAQLVERAWLSLGGDTWLNATQLANTRRFFQLLDDLEDEGQAPGLDPNLLEARLRHLYAEPDPIPLHNPYVELLTIHKAKGLEWDVVLIPALEKSTRTNRAPLLTWSEINSPDSSKSSHTSAFHNGTMDIAASAAEPSPAHIMLAPIAGRGEPSRALNAWLNCIHKSRETAEIKRLFYVACTRARQELHLFASPQLSTKGALNPVADSLLKAAWPAAEAHFAAAPSSAFVTTPIGTQTWAQALELESFPKSVPLSLAASVEPDAHTLVRATAAGRPSSPILQRLPRDFDPAARFISDQPHRLAYAESAFPLAATRPNFSRPEGSYAARSFGNTVHALLDLLSTRILQGETPTALLTELPNWTARIAALLRADGLPRPTVDRLTREVRTALANTLSDPDGQWLLFPHTRSSSELSLTAEAFVPEIGRDFSSGISGDQSNRALAPGTSPSNEPPQNPTQPTSVRVDRLFEAGPAPHTSGDSFLWIIDYKTTAPGPPPLADFLAAQRSTYGPQLETYAQILSAARAKTAGQLRLALYFPTIPHLLWWPLIDA
jgi:ATP-dependent helicase/nuclease subunit A